MNKITLSDNVQTAMCSADVETCTNLIKNNKDGRLENI
jgi:hypothetical protein